MKNSYDRNESITSKEYHKKYISLFFQIFSYGYGYNL